MYEKLVETKNLRAEGRNPEPESLGHFYADPELEPKYITGTAAGDGSVKKKRKNHGSASLTGGMLTYVLHSEPILSVWLQSLYLGMSKP